MTRGDDNIVFNKLYELHSPIRLSTPFVDDMNWYVWNSNEINAFNRYRVLIEDAISVSVIAHLYERK